MRVPSKVGLIFIDGVGVGARDEAINPLAKGRFLLSQFADGTGEPLPSGGTRRDLDTTFDVPGRPQSASNQTALFTGLPAPKLIGAHVLGYPNRALAELLAASSVAKQLVAKGRDVTFANAYPIGYLDALALPRRPGTLGAFELEPRWRRRLKPSASTLAFAAAQVPFRTLDDAERGEALTHDIDGVRASRRFTVPHRTPEAAAAIFWALSTELTLFEHALADEAGHAQDFGFALETLGVFDRFVRELVRLKPADAQLLIVSDHGNVEDLTTRNHTRNPVALLSFGPAEVESLGTLADVGSAIVRWLGPTP